MQTSLRSLFITTLLCFFLPAYQASYAQGSELINAKPDVSTLKVVASFSILADMASSVGGDFVEVYSLVGPGEDVHVYQPRPKDAKLLATADVLIINGLGFEGWIERLILASGYQGPIVNVSDGIPLRIADHASHDHSHDHGSHAGSDPHAWQSINNAKVYVANIAQALIALDKQRQEDYVLLRDTYLQELEQLQLEFVRELARVPVEKRKLLTSHLAYRYFEADYEIRFFGAQGINTKSDVSAKGLAKIIRLIRSENITAAFFERNSDQRLLELIARETECVIAGSLYSDSLSSSDGPASTYLAMMRYNMKTILSALLPHTKG